MHIALLEPSLFFVASKRFKYTLGRLSLLPVVRLRCLHQIGIRSIKDEIDTFHEHLNRQNLHIQITKEIVENGKIPFLDGVVSCDENKVRTTIYRKPTHIDRLLDQSSYNPTSHKATIIQTLTRRAQLVCDSTDSLTDETNYLNNVFSKNNYNADFIRRNTYKPAQHNGTNANPTPTTTATIPYIKGTSETIARILQPYNIRVAHKPITTL